jgi:hypothetical protein
MDNSWLEITMENAAGMVIFKAKCDLADEVKGWIFGEEAAGDGESEKFAMFRVLKDHVKMAGTFENVDYPEDIGSISNSREGNLTADFGLKAGLMGYEILGLPSEPL